MVELGPWQRARDYGSPRDECLAVRERVGIIDVSTLGKLKLTGPGVPDLLQRIYLNKWRKRAVGRVRYGLMSNVLTSMMPRATTASNFSNAIARFQWGLARGKCVR